jgi:hypothetical protein
VPIRSYLGSVIIIFTYIGMHDKKIWRPLRRVQSTGNEKIPAYGGSAAVKRECLLSGGLEDCYWWEI